MGAVLVVVIVGIVGSRQSDSRLCCRIISAPKHHREGLSRLERLCQGVEHVAPTRGCYHRFGGVESAAIGVENLVTAAVGGDIRGVVRAVGLARFGCKGLRVGAVDVKCHIAGEGLLDGRGDDIPLLGSARDVGKGFLVFQQLLLPEFRARLEVDSVAGSRLVEKVVAVDAVRRGRDDGV